MALTLILLTWRRGRVPINISKWQKGFNLALRVNFDYFKIVDSKKRGGGKQSNIQTRSCKFCCRGKVISVT